MPWEFVPASPIPEEVRKDKKLRDTWINTPTTKHCVYTFCEGVNPNLRISRPRNDGGGNPIHALHALVADYDAPQPEERALEYAKALPFAPNWVERTLSGNWRFVWLLSEPLIFPSFDFARHFLKSFGDFAFDPARGMVGFDKKAWEAPERLWTNSCDWRHVTDERIPVEVSRGWMVKASGSFKFTEKEFGPAIPLEEIKPELAKRYPSFAAWPGDFVVNSQGPTFWIPESQSPKSAIVRETGIQTFSAHAAKGFYSWADLLGAAFVSEYEAASLGRAVEGIHYDGRYYWRKILDDSWQPFEKSDLTLHLKASRGVSTKPDKAGVSPVDRALEHIQNAQRITAATPFIFQPTGIVHRHGKKFLNTSQVRVVQPAEGSTVWGPQGNFPWLSQFFNIFPDDHSRSVVLAWIAWGYKGAYALEPTSGHVLFMCGPVGVGKTLLNRGILGTLFGGFAEAGPFLTGEDNFNSELFNVGYWCQDDGSVSSDPRKMRMFSEMIKRVAANPTFRNNGKFLRATMSEWCGRLGISCNADEESMMQLPETGLSNLDKLILVRTAQQAPVVFPPKAEITRTLERELPWFARWLLDWEIPASLRGASRFGISEYADPTLLETSRQSSRTAGFAEILEDWKHQYFNVRETKATEWVGTAFQLHKEIMLDPTAESAMRHFTVDAIGRHLASLKQKTEGIETLSRGDTRLWKITKHQQK